MSRLTLATAAAAAISGLATGYIIGRYDQPIVKVTIPAPYPIPTALTPEQKAHVHASFDWKAPEGYRFYVTRYGARTKDERFPTATEAMRAFWDAVATLS